MLPYFLESLTAGGLFLASLWIAYGIKRNATSKIQRFDSGSLSSRTVMTLAAAALLILVLVLQQPAAASAWWATVIVALLLVLLPIGFGSSEMRESGLYFGGKAIAWNTIRKLDSLPDEDSGRVVIKVAAVGQTDTSLSVTADESEILQRYMEGAARMDPYPLGYVMKNHIVTWGLAGLGTAAVSLFWVWAVGV